MIETIDEICKMILEEPRANSYDLCESTQAITFLLSRPEFGYAELQRFLVDRCLALSGGNAAIFSLEETKETYSKMCRGKMYGYSVNAMEVRTDNVFIFDEINWNKDYILEIAQIVPNLKLIAIDHLVLLPFDKSTDFYKLTHLYQKLGAPILIACHLSRGAEDNPNGCASLVDVVAALRRAKAPVHFIKECKKLVLYRPHDCKRGIGTACAYNIDTQATIRIYDRNGLTDSYTFDFPFGLYE